MRKGKWLRRLVKKGYSIPFAPDDPQRPNKPVVAHGPRLEKNLGRSRDLLQKGRTAEGLQKLNLLAAATTSPKRKAQIIALTGDSEFKAGRFDNAINAYRSAATYANSDARGWVRPAIGEIKALLKAARVEEAHAKALATWQRSYAQHEEQQRQIALQQAHLQQIGKVLIKKRPHRASVIAFRLGYLFLLEGETASAQEFFLNSITVNPTGGSRARHGLALIALALRNPEEACSRARESLLLGKFQAKTIGVWPTLVAAQQQRGIKGIDSDLLAGIQQIKVSTVRARAILAVVRALREYHDPSWEAIASDWIAREGTAHPTIATELRKLSLAKLRLHFGKEAQASAAADLLLSSHLLSRTEHVSVSKLYVRASLLQGQGINIQTLKQQAISLYGVGSSNRFAQHLAGACIAANRSDLAVPLLTQNLSSAPETRLWWKARWALAQLKQADGAVNATIDLFVQCYQNTLCAPRIRTLSAINAIRAASESTDLTAPPIPVQVIISLALQSQDYGVIIDAARALHLIKGNSYASDALSLLISGEVLALRLFTDAQRPDQAVVILNKLAAAQVDLGQQQRVAAFWQNLPPEKKQWLWSEKSEFWAYLGNVYEALPHEIGAELAETYLNDPSTPPHGYAALAARYALVLLTFYCTSAGVRDKTFGLLKRMIDCAPSNPYSSLAWYWTALAASRKNDGIGVSTAISSLRQAIGRWTGARCKWLGEMLANARALEVHLSASALGQSALDVAAASQISIVRRDLKRALWVL